VRIQHQPRRQAPARTAQSPTSSLKRGPDLISQSQGKQKKYSNHVLSPEAVYIIDLQLDSHDPSERKTIREIAGDL
jgi:hypothetical protein